MEHLPTSWGASGLIHRNMEGRRRRREGEEETEGKRKRGGRIEKEEER